MNANAELVVGIVTLIIVGFAVFAAYTWQQRRRVRDVESWIVYYLQRHFVEMPRELRINCSNDRLWPVLVDFVEMPARIQHHWQFNCVGDQSSLLLVSERERDRYVH